MLGCIIEDGTNFVLDEVHEGIYESHIGGMALAKKTFKSQVLLAEDAPKYC